VPETRSPLLSVLLPRAKISRIPSQRIFTGMICPAGGLSRRLRDKSRMFEFIPEWYDSFVYLDADTGRGGASTELQFIRSLGVHSVSDKVGERRADQKQYNTGVIFFRPTEKLCEVFCPMARTLRAYGHGLQG
jgi:hypothetical protein